MTSLNQQPQGIGNDNQSCWSILLKSGKKYWYTGLPTRWKPLATFRWIQPKNLTSNVYIQAFITVPAAVTGAGESAAPLCPNARWLHHHTRWWGCYHCGRRLSGGWVPHTWGGWGWSSGPEKGPQCPSPKHRSGQVGSPPPSPVGFVCGESNPLGLNVHP